MIALVAMLLAAPPRADEAIARFADDRDVQALRTALEAEVAKPRPSAAALEALARLELSERRYAEAATALERAVAAAGKAPRAKVLARRLALVRAGAEAAPDAQAAPLARLAVDDAQLLLRAGETRAAAEQALAAAELAPGLFEPWALAAQAALDGGDRRAALEWGIAALQRCPAEKTQALSLRLLGLAGERSAALWAAEARWEAAFTLAPGQTADGLRAVGQSVLAGRPDRARAMLDLLPDAPEVREAEARLPGLPPASPYRADHARALLASRAALDAGNAAQAQALLEAALAKGQSAELTRALAASLLAQGKKDEAAAALDGVDPADAVAVLLRSRIAVLRGQPAQAVAVLSAVPAASPLAQLVALELVRARGYAGANGADGPLSAQVARRPGDAAAWHALGELLLSRGDGRGAQRALQRAVDLRGELARYHLSLSAALFKIGDKPGGLREAEVATRLGPAADAFERVLAEEP